VVRELLALTAEAFGASAPSLRGLSYGDSLKTFAMFSRDEAERSLRTGTELDEIRNALYRRAFALGNNSRRWLMIRTLEESMLAARLLYSCCSIDLRGSPRGVIAVHRCFFSSYYTGDVCRVIASLDEGLLAGLSGGRRLSFSQRITEGAMICKGILAESEQR
jgi:hypothetical protein